MPVSSLPLCDLDHCVEGVGARQWERLRGTRIFLTGATGIIGKWLLETVAEADRRFDLGVELVALSRDPARFAADEPGLAALPNLTMIRGDVRSFDMPEGRFDFVIHAATDVVAPGGPLDVFDTCVAGTRRVLDFAVRAGASNLLLLSSGAVYGPQPGELERMPEDYSGGPDLGKSNAAYGEGKRVSEWLFGTYARENGLRANIARIYALVGPHLPLDKHFAIGNFIRDSLAGQPITIKGGGTEVRSYLHLADVTTWLWQVLFNEGPETTFNVGSSEGITLAELAHRVAAVLDNRAGVQILGNAVAPGLRDRYVPDTRRAQELLGAEKRIGLDEAIRRTAEWYSSSGQVAAAAALS